jgi:hypothetical protein
VNGAYTFAKELTNGANSDTSYLTPNPPLINDVFNRAQAKQLSKLRPSSFVGRVVQLPDARLHSSDSGAMKFVSAILKDWTLSGVLRYQSGDLIRTPPSTNALLTQLGRGAENNPATWGGGNTFWNRVEGQPFLTKDPNCHCIDPQHDLAVEQGGVGRCGARPIRNFGSYYNDFRGNGSRRRPSASDASSVWLGKTNSPLTSAREFQNVFQPLVLERPERWRIRQYQPSVIYDQQSTRPVDRRLWLRQLGAGAGARPRTGQIVARLTF